MVVSKHFKINGNSYSNKELLEYAKILTKSEDYHKAVGEFILEWLSAETKLVVKTSGSTGIPKNIYLSKQHMINSAKATGEFFDVRENTNALLCLSAEYIAGKMMLVRAMTLGWNIDLIAPESDMSESITKRYEFAAMVPLQVENSFVSLNKIDTLIIGGAPVSNKLFQNIQQLETKCYATYGMTETITHIAVRRLNHGPENYYTTLSNVRIALDERDCLVIDAPQVSFEQVVTNDLVHIHSNNQFEWLGRYDNVINSGGIKLFPERIEFKLSKSIDSRYFVSGISDEKLGQKLILVVESNLSETEKESLLKKIKGINELDKFEVPKDILCIPSFQETTTGKVQRSKTLEYQGL